MTIKVVSTFGLGNEFIKSKKSFNCILGVSVGSRDFSKEKIQEYLRFCLEHFDKILIIIVDEIKKYNFMAFQGMLEKEAKEKALFEGDEMTVAVKRVVKSLNLKDKDKNKIKIIRYEDAAKKIPVYKKTIMILKKQVENDSFFRKDALLMTEAYAEKRKINKENMSMKDVALNFLIEETALFLLLGKSTEEKYCIDVYPGKFSVIENILKGKYKSLLEKLPQDIIYGQVEIKIE